MTNRTGNPAPMRVRRSLTIVGAAIVVLGLGACREGEQNRPLAYEKGVYQGSADTALSEDQVRELRYRGNQQKY